MIKAAILTLILCSSLFASCEYGQSWNYSLRSCVKVIIPENGKLNYYGNDWECKKGYTKNYSNRSCDYVEIPENGELNYYGNGWNCKNGFKKNYATNNCEIDSSSNTAGHYYSECAENGSCYGDISDQTRKPKTVEVKGYYRRNGTYVRGHYRSK
jgi:hypothetical protein